MKVHHLNCATLCPIAAWLTGVSKAVCHCLLIETDEGLVLVDAGLSAQDQMDPRRMGPLFTWLLHAQRDPLEPAVAQVEAMGFSPEDVRHVVLTHMDLDHASGLVDFPKAQVHLLERERDAALAQANHRARARYLPYQWAHGPIWQTYRPEDGEPWFGFDGARRLRGLPPEILLVPLIGHTMGHAGVAVQSDQGWLLHAGDAYFHRAEVDPARPRLPLAMDLFRRLAQTDGRLRARSQERLRALNAAQGGALQIFCAHDPVEYEAAAKGA